MDIYIHEGIDDTTDLSFPNVTYHLLSPYAAEREKATSFEMACCLGPHPLKW